jgi:hypothetical protein
MKHIPALIILFILITPINLALAVSDSVQVTQEVYICDQDGICEAFQRENETNCSSDCGCDFDKNCEPERKETYNNCPSDCPVLTPSGTAIFDTIPPIIFDLLIEKITPDSAIIFWKTNEPSLCQVFFGETLEYEKGSLSETTFSFKHSSELTNLFPETTYYFKIKCKDANQNESEIKDQKFSTLALPDLIPPANIRNFEAIPGDRKISLFWQNPPDPDFKAVKIMRSTDFYPLSPKEGTLVYDNSGTFFVDKDLINGTKYYYTAFSYDFAGNYASGAMISAIPQPPLPPEIILPEIEKITLKDFEFFQEEKRLPLIEEKRILAEPEKPLTISIDYQKVTEFTKTIMMILEREEKVYSYLLKLDPEKKKFETNITPPEPGLYSLKFLLLDNQNRVLKEILGQLQIKKIEIIPPPKIPWYKNLEIWLKIIVYSLIGVIILGVIAYLVKRLLRK